MKTVEGELRPIHDLDEDQLRDLPRLVDLYGSVLGNLSAPKRKKLLEACHARRGQLQELVDHLIELRRLMNGVEADVRQPTIEEAA